MVYGSKFRNRRKATATVELAVILPFLLPLLLGVWEVGRLLEAQQILSNAAREGGRHAATGNATATEVRQVVIDYLVNNKIPIANAKVTIENLTSSSRPDPIDANQLDQFRITVEIPFNEVRWILLDQITNVDTIRGYAEWFSMKDIPIEVNLNIPLE